MSVLVTILTWVTLIVGTPLLGLVAANKVVKRKARQRGIRCIIMTSAGSWNYFWCVGFGDPPESRSRRESELENWSVIYGKSDMYAIAKTLVAWNRVRLLNRSPLLPTNVIYDDGEPSAKDLAHVNSELKTWAESD